MSIVNRSQSSGGSTPRSDFNHARNAKERAGIGDQHGCPAHLGISLADVRSAVTQLPRVPRDAVHRDPGVATQVLTLARPRHRPDAELAVVEVRIGAAQPRRAVSTDGSEHRVGRRRQDCTNASGKVGFDVLDIGEGGHQPSLVHGAGPPAGQPARIGPSPHVVTVASGDKEPTVGPRSGRDRMRAATLDRGVTAEQGARFFLGVNDGGPRTTGDASPFRRRGAPPGQLSPNPRAKGADCPRGATSPSSIAGLCRRDRRGGSVAVAGPRLDSTPPARVEMLVRPADPGSLVMPSKPSRNDVLPT